MRYFQLLHCEESEYRQFGIAYANEGSQLLQLPPTGVLLNNWFPESITCKGGKCADYMANNFSGRLFSSQLKELIASVSSNACQLQWLEVGLEAGDERSSYFVLRFPQNVDVIDQGKSLLAGSRIVKPVFSQSLLMGIDVFSLPNEYAKRTYVSEKVMRSVLSANLTGLSFSEVKVV